jgi:DNA-binding beta-propeller fold protein YncE
MNRLSTIGLLLALTLAAPFRATPQAKSGSSPGYVNPQNPFIWGSDQIMNYGKPPYKLNYIPGQIEEYWKCVNGYWVFYRYYKTYPGVNGFKVQTGAFPTNKQCDPKQSVDPKGNPAPNSKSTAQPAQNGQTSSQGSTPPPAGSGASGSGNPGKAIGESFMLRSAKAASTSTAAFDFTLPYRALPFMPYFPEADPAIDISCASQLKPTAYSVDHINATVTLYDLCTSDTLAAINVTSNPLQIRITPDASQAIVTSYDNGITFIDTATNQITKAIATDPGFFPSGIAISPDGSYALITNYDDLAPELGVLNIASQSITSTIPLSTSYPQSVFINPDGTLAWVTYPWYDTVDVVDIMTGAVVQRLSIQTPFDVAFNATGTAAYIASGTGSVVVLDTSTYTQTASVPAGNGAFDLSVSLDGDTVTLNNYLDGTITMFDPRLAPFSITTSAGTFPRGVAQVPLQ